VKRYSVFLVLPIFSAGKEPGGPSAIEREKRTENKKLRSRRSVAAKAEAAKENPQWQEKQYLTGEKLKLLRQSPKFTSFG
jgi:hypothetical protein